MHKVNNQVFTSAWTPGVQPVFYAPRCSIDGLYSRFLNELAPNEPFNIILFI